MDLPRGFCFFEDEAGDRVAINLDEVRIIVVETDERSDSLKLSKIVLCVSGNFSETKEITVRGKVDDVVRELCVVPRIVPKDSIQV